jgi:YesN/AraC family two-component response regulator
MERDESMKQSADDQVHLLIVDDEEPIRRSLGDLGKHLGYQVHTAEDGLAGWEKFQEIRPTIVVMDIYMPRLNGLLAMSMMKEIEPECPVILITGYQHYQLMTERHHLQPDGFILKPFDLPTITDSMVQLIEKRRNPAILLPVQP